MKISTDTSEKSAKPDTELQTNFWRIFFSLLIAAALPAAFPALSYVYPYGLLSPQPMTQSGVSNGVAAFLFGFFVWLLGLTILGGPVWVALHHTGRRHWGYAIAAGFFVPFLVLLAVKTSFFSGKTAGNWSSFGEGGQLWIDGTITPFGWFDALRSSALFGGIGAAQGFVVWCLAYRRVPVAH